MVAVVTSERIIANNQRERLSIIDGARSSVDKVICKNRKQDESRNMNGARNEAPRRVVDETRRLYADLLAQPLDEKQLARPSFKFIQDVVKKVSISVCGSGS